MTRISIEKELSDGSVIRLEASNAEEFYELLDCLVLNDHRDLITDAFAALGG